MTFDVVATMKPGYHVASNVAPAYPLRVSLLENPAAQLQNVVIDGVERGDIKTGHTGYAELQQTVRAALDPLWKPDADVKAVLSGVCTKINPLLSK